jgi:hypothetical protein
VVGTGGRTEIAATIKKIALEWVSPVIRARLIDLNQPTKKGPAEAGPTPRSACLSSIANLPATIGIANAVGAAAAARAGPYHNAWCYIGTANAVKTPVPAGAAATGDGNCQRGLCLWRDRHGLGGGCA